MLGRTLTPFCWKPERVYTSLLAGVAMKMVSGVGALWSAGKGSAFPRDAHVPVQAVK